ncbi:DNA/RNA nuclease SfsA [Thalassobacillus pellis]|uniref:DNA/RNA nuclease SfsA n=1 Tax=Thalassobacillus pellis TaxID=748008 RepID=UPI00196063CA|nr:DNA/RNA nuclease SfsA [Thalassobacillus pellis]MBM7552546.1 sugar fermentation stimulation protein A [Thalassobacillus pellis]
MTGISFAHKKLYQSIFVERPNRFIIHCQLIDADKQVRVHLPDPGRLKKLLIKGTIVYLTHHNDPGRKTNWSAVMAEDPASGALVSLNTLVANQLVEVLLKGKQIPSFRDWNFIRKEFQYEGSRFDFLLEKDGRELVLEVKSVTWKTKDEGRFPDAVTDRGKKHVEKLTAIQKNNNMDTAILFVAQREDICAVTVADEIDPDFAAAIKLARKAGVNIRAIGCKLDPSGIRYKGEIVFSQG